EMGRLRQRHQHAGIGLLTVLDVTRQRTLARIEIDRTDAMTIMQQRDDEMHRRGRLARPALLVAEHDHVRPRHRQAAFNQTAVSWNTAPPFGRPGSALTNAFTPTPPSKALFGQMLSITTTPRNSPSNK